MKLISCIFFLFLVASSIADNWELKQTDDSINIYTRQVVGSNFNEFKADAIINAKIASILALIKNEEDYINWNYKTNHAEIIKKEGNSIYIYAISSAPWPVKDRDLVLEYRFEIDHDKQAVTIKTQIAPNLVSKKKNVVRITQNDGYIKLESINENQTKISLQVKAEPGGGIPAWMANFASTDTPYYMITKIRELVQKEKYKNATTEELSF